MTTARRDVLAWRKRDAAKPPPLLKYRSSKVFILSTLCIAIFTDIFLYAVIVPVIPFALSARAGVAEEDVQHWVSVLLAVYGAALVVGSPISGFFADRTKSRRLPLLLGLLALAGATLMLCLGRNIVVMIIGRLLQGLSAAVVWTVGLALLVDTVGAAEIGQMLGYVSMSVTLATLLAPVLGGVVLHEGGYYSVYLMSFGMVLLDVILRTVLVEKKVARQWINKEESHVTDIPLPDHSHTHGSTVPDSEPDAGTHQSNRRPVLALLSSHRLWSALWCSLVQSLLMSAWDATLPLHVAHLFNFSSLGAGLVFLPFALPAFFAPLIGKYVDAHGTRLPAVVGFLSCAPPLVLLLLVNHSGIRQVVLLCALLAVLGFTLTVAMMPIIVEVTYIVTAIEKKHPGGFGGRGAIAQAYGIYNCAFAGGMLIGPLWGGLIVGKAGWGTMCWSLGILSTVSAVPAALWTGGWIFGKKTEKAGGAGAQGTTVEGGLQEAERDGNKHDGSPPVGA